jgi:hypothetical protein
MDKSQPSLSYHPWEIEGITECEYWKRRFLACRKERYELANCAKGLIHHVRQSARWSYEYDRTDWISHYLDELERLAKSQ